VQERFERGDTDLVETASMMVESLADLILLAPESDRFQLDGACALAFGQIVLEKGGAIDGGSNATH
jgi:ABC-type tungstate transport system substrate-binding protein